MTTYFKYPHTPHLPFSESVSEDDVILNTTIHFEGKEVVATEKMDGENTSLYCDHIHARSIDNKNHPSRNWVKALHGSIKHLIPAGWRIIGENLYATHSIHYKNLESYFYVFSIWDETNTALSWDETLVWCDLLDLHHVPVLYRGVWNEALIKGLYQPVLNGNEMEGYVVRLAERISYKDFSKSLCKWVRKNHIQTDQHWLEKPVVPNELLSK